MKKGILLLFGLLAITLSAHAQKFALIDMEYILKNIPAYQSANEQLEEASKQWMAEVNKLSQEAKTLYENYQKTQKSLTANQQTQKEDEIVAKEKAAADLRRQYFGPEGDLATKRDSLMRPIQDAVYEAVKAVAMRDGYDVVVDRASAASIIFAMPDIDISDDVLAQMGYAS